LSAGEKPPPSDYQHVDLERVDVVHPRSVGAEHVALQTLRRLGLEVKLAELGFNRPQLNAAIGTLVGRMVHPGRELATHQWLGQRSALGELIGCDFADLDLNRFYCISDRLPAHHAALEGFFYRQECELFALTETITLYDLTNTYFEGNAKTNPKAARAHSKEKRSDCPLVTLALVLDASGFPKRGEVQRPQRQRAQDPGADAGASEHPRPGRRADGGSWSYPVSGVTPFRWTVECFRCSGLRSTSLQSLRVKDS
jgi:hypothetical protein